jgi:hypothetical protein
MKYFYFSGMIVYLMCMSACADRKENVRIAYPTPFPGAMAKKFLPGIVCSDSLDFNSAFSSDGKIFYFARTIGGKWQILQSQYDGAEWSSPVIAPFSEKEYSQADPFFTDDGSVYYISNRPRTVNDTLPDFDIWVVHPLKQGGWSAPENVEVVNSDSAEYYVSLSKNGNLYFASARAGGYGLHDIYMSRFVDGKHQQPENLGPEINAVESDHDPLISPDERTLIFTSENRKDSFGEADFYYSMRTPDGRWAAAQNMGKLYNTSTYEYCPNYSPDLKYFFFSSEYDVKWISVEALPFKVK